MKFEYGSFLNSLKYANWHIKDAISELRMHKEGEVTIAPDLLAKLERIEKELEALWNEQIRKGARYIPHYNPGKLDI